ncbi:Nucleic acid dioxygenase ALKBH1 [Asimina triloba]
MASKMKPKADLFCRWVLRKRPGLLNLGVVYWCLDMALIVLRGMLKARILEPSSLLGMRSSIVKRMIMEALPGAFPAVVAGAVRSLFEKIADLDMECRTRLILWFSHHLANFQFIWPWEEWAHVLDLPRWAPQRVFVQEILEREIRLSYWDKIKQSIENAPALEELLPPKGVPSFKYNSEDAAESAEFKLSTELNSMVKGKKTAREIISWVDESVIPVHGSSVALEVIIQTLLDIGSKSFTHLITVLERYGQVISKLCPDQEKQVQLICEVGSYWKNNAQMTAIAIDRMMGYRLVSNLAIIEWVFSPINIEQFHMSDCPWEILTNTVNKTYNRITDLRKEISSLEKAVLSAEDSAAKAKADLEVAESKLELVNGEPVQSENPGRLKRLKALADRAKEDEVKARDSLEAKEALLARACDDSEALFISLYKSFAHVLTERLPLAYADGEINGPASGSADEISVEADEPSSAMDVDKENGKSDRNQTNGTSYSTGEQVQWCRTTLGYVKAFSRQYATEIWKHIEKLDTEVFVEETHLLFRKAVFTGLRRPV